MTGAAQLKIGIVFDDSLDNPDGVQQYILSLGRWLTEQGHEIHFLVGKTLRTDIDDVHSLSRNLQVKFNGNRLSIPLPTSKRKLTYLLESEQFDVLHVQMPYSPWLAQRLILAAPNETRIIGTFHIVANSSLVTLATKFLAVWTGRSLKRFDKIVSVSSAAQSFAKQTYGIDSDILPNVFDYERFARAEPISTKPAKTNILFLGRLVERKGCRYLLEAVKILKDRGLAGYQVTICGKGELSEPLTAYANEYDLPVNFVGFVSEENKPAVYAAADIAVFPSIGGESFGIVLVEAMASGRAAVIAASNSGYASVLKPRPDLLFSIKDPVALADKLEQLLSNPSIRKENAAWGKQYAKQFDVEVIGETLLGIYRD